MALDKTKIFQILKSFSVFEEEDGKVKIFQKTKKFDKALMLRKV